MPNVFGTVEEKHYGICWCLQATAFVADHLPELTIFTNTLLFARDSIVGLQLKALSNKTKFFYGFISSAPLWSQS